MKNGEKAQDSKRIELEEYGAAEAERLCAAGYFSGKREARRIRALLHELSGVKAETLGAAGEWLADNRYLIEREALAAARDFAAVKRVRAGRVNSLAAEAGASLAARVDGAVTLSSAEAYFAGFRRVNALTLGELALLGASLRAGLAELIASEFSSRAPDVRRVSAAIESLRALSTADMTSLVECADAAGAILSRDPAGAYAGMDERTRAGYRRRLARLAARADMSESECPHYLNR